MQEPIFRQCLSAPNDTTARQLGEHKNLFIKEFTSYWHNRVEKSQKLKHFYYTFKTANAPEKYLTSNINPQHRQVFAAFRLGNHKLAIKTMRYSRPKIPYEERLCPFCKTEVEDETHFFFKCLMEAYTGIREAFLSQVSQIVTKFCLLNEVDKTFYPITQESQDLTTLTASFIFDLTACRDKQLR